MTYTRDRMLAEEIVIPKSVYEERKEQFERRVRAMVGYATNDMVCRSRQLLRYFGEKDSHDCQQCDVCIDRRSMDDKEKAEKEAEEKIIELLSDHERHHVAELHNIDCSPKAMQEAIRLLVNEEIVKTEQSYIYLD